MTVQLHALPRTVVHAHRRKIRYFCHTDHRTDCQLPVKRIIYRNAFQPVKAALFQLVQKFRKLLVVHKHFHLNRVRKIRNLKAHNRPLIADLTLIKHAHLAADGNLAHLAPNLFNIDCLVLKITPENNIRIIGTLERPSLKASVFTVVSTLKTFFLHRKRRRRSLLFFCGCALVVDFWGQYRFVLMFRARVCRTNTACDMLHNLLNADFIVLLIFSRLRFLIRNKKLYAKPAPLVHHLIQNSDKRILLGLCNHAVLKDKLHCALIQKIYVRLTKHRIKHMFTRF